MMFRKCKITVVKKDCNTKLINSYVRKPDQFCACDQVQENQEFYISNPFQMPEGICAWAWADIRPQIMAVASGSTFEFLKEQHTALASCSDLFRPVVFKIERVDD